MNSRRNFIRSTGILAAASLLIPNDIVAQTTFIAKEKIKPQALKSGDTIAITSPAGAIWDESQIETFAAILRSFGFNVVFGKTLNEKFEINPLSQFMIQILTSVSEMERSTIRQRIKSGYDSYRKSGGKVGRKEGFRKDKDRLLNEHKDVAKLLRQGYSIRKVMKLTDKSSGTIQKIKRNL